MLEKIDIIIAETQALFDTYVEKFGLFSNMTKSVYISLTEQYNIRKRLEEMEEKENV